MVASDSILSGWKLKDWQLTRLWAAVAAFWLLPFIALCGWMVFMFFTEGFSLAALGLSVVPTVMGAFMVFLLVGSVIIFFRPDLQLKKEPVEKKTYNKKNELDEDEPKKKPAKAKEKKPWFAWARRKPKPDKKKKAVLAEVVD